MDFQNINTDTMINTDIIINNNIFNNDIQPLEFNIQEDNLPVTNNDIELTIDDLLDDLDLIINRINIRNYILKHINYIRYVSRQDELNDDNVLNDIITEYNNVSTDEFHGEEINLIDNFKDIINQADLDQLKMIHEIFEGLAY